MIVIRIACPNHRYFAFPRCRNFALSVNVHFSFSGADNFRTRVLRHLYLLLLTYAPNVRTNKFTGESTDCVLDVHESDGWFSR